MNWRLAEKMEKILKEKQETAIENDRAGAGGGEAGAGGGL